jgi:hypothetical protein
MVMRHRAGIVLALAIVAFAHSAEPRKGAAPAEPPYRDYGRALVHYATVERAGGVTRRLFVDPAALPALKDGFLPDRTFVAMEVFESGKGLVRIEMKRWKDGGWLYGQHEPQDRLWTTGTNATCESCHAKAKGRFEMFTFDSLVRFSREGRIDRFACHAPDREPCDAAIYKRP